MHVYDLFYNTQTESGRTLAEGSLALSSGVKAFKNMVISSKKLISADLKNKIRKKLSQNIVL